MTAIRRASRRPPRRPLLAAVLAGWGALACGGAGSDSTVPVERDSAGVRIVEHPAAAHGPSWQLDPDPTVVIGGGGLQNAGEGLYRVTAGFRRSDGGVVVANTGTQEVRFYGPDGRLRLAAGGEGEGPGEFRALDWLGRRGDSAIAADARLARITVIDPAGEVVRTFGLEKTTDVPYGRVIAGFADGSFLARGFAIIEDGMSPGIHRYDSPHYRFGPDGAFLGDVGRFRGTATYYEPTAGGGFSFTTPLFNRTTQMVAGDGYFLFADNARWEIERRAPDGTPLQLIRRRAPPRPVTPDLLARAREARLEDARSPAGRRALGEMLDGMPPPVTLPAYGQIVIGREGYLWVEDYPVPGSARVGWTVFAPSGRAVARLTAPAGLTWLEVGTDYLLARWQDDLDVEHVGLFDLAR